MITKKPLTITFINMETARSPVNTAPSVVTLPDEAERVKCDGGGGVLGHPSVTYSFDGKSEVTCLYCSRTFVKKTACC